MSDVVLTVPGTRHNHELREGGKEGYKKRRTVHVLEQRQAEQDR